MDDRKMVGAVLQSWHLSVMRFFWQFPTHGCPIRSRGSAPNTGALPGSGRYSSIASARRPKGTRRVAGATGAAGCSRRRAAHEGFESGPLEMVIGCETLTQVTLAYDHKRNAIRCACCRNGR